MALLPTMFSTKGLPLAWVIKLSILQVYLPRQSTRTVEAILLNYMHKETSSMFFFKLYLRRWLGGTSNVAGKDIFLYVQGCILDFWDSHYRRREESSKCCLLNFTQTHVHAHAWEGGERDGGKTESGRDKERPTTNLDFLKDGLQKCNFISSIRVFCSYW